MDAKLVDLERKPMGRLLAQYSLPAIVGMAATSVYNIVDAIYIGQCCGPYAIAAIALVFPIMNLMVAVGSMVGLGCAATASIALGQQDFNRAFRILGHCLIISILSGILIGWVPMLFFTPMLQLFGATEPTLQPAYDFMMVMMLGFPITGTFMNLNHVMRASGYPVRAMVSLLLSMVINIVGAHLFIYEFGWGMTGAGLATIAGQLVGMVWVFAHFLKKNSVLHFCRNIYKLCGPIVRRICLVGMPPCLLNACGCVVVVFYNQQLLHYEGEMGVGAFGVINRVIFFFAMIVLGITQGMQPIAGYNLGMGNYSRVKRVLWYAILAATMLTTIGWLCMELFPREIVHLFVKESDEESTRLVDLATRGMQIMVIFFPLIGSQIVIGNFFQAIGRPIMSVFLNLMRQCIMLIPLLIILPTWWGSDGIWIAQATADILSVILGFTVLYLFFTRVFIKKTYTPTLHE